MRADQRDRPDLADLTALLWRAAVPLAALVALSADASVAVVGGLALAGLALAAERLARLRHLGVLDGVATWLGGLLVALVLVGVLLGSTDLGLSVDRWVLALAVLSLAGLLLAAVLPGRPVGPPAVAADLGVDAATGEARTTRRTVLGLLPWVALVLVVAVIAVRMSVDAQEASETVPLSMSFGEVDGTRVEVVVESTEAAGPLEVRASAGANVISYPNLSVPADGTTTTTVSLPRTGRFVVTLSEPGSDTPLRSLVLDR